MNLKKFTFVALLATATGAAAYAGLADQVAKSKKAKQPSYSARSVASALAVRDYSPFPSGTDTEEIAYKSWVEGQGYLTSADLGGYATTNWVYAQDYVDSTELETALGDYATDQDLVDLATAFDGIVDGVTNAMTVGTENASTGKTTITLRTGVSADAVTTEKDPTVPAWAKAANAPTYSFDDLTSHPVTLSGYGITDAKIESGTITLGSATITPLTSFTETDPTVPAWAKAGTKPSYAFSEITGTPTTLAGYGITDAYTKTETNTALDGKMDKDTDGVDGNVAKIDANGNAVDGGTALSTIVSGAAAGATAYQLPSGGIPKTDLASGVQTSLGLADTALQASDLNGYAKLNDNTQSGSFYCGALTLSGDLTLHGDDGTSYKLGVDANGQLYLTQIQ